MHFPTINEMLLRARSQHSRLPALLVVDEAQLPALISARSSAPRVALLLATPLLVVSDCATAPAAGGDLTITRVLGRPLTPGELVGAIVELLSGGRAAPEPSMLRLDVSQLSVRHGEAPPVTLTPREFQILTILDKAAGRMAARAELFAQVWSDVRVCNKVLDVHVSKLRRKLAPLGATITFRRPATYQLEVAGGPAQGALDLGQPCSAAADLPPT